MNKILIFAILGFLFPLNLPAQTFGDFVDTYRRIAERQYTDSGVNVIYTVEDKKLDALIWPIVEKDDTLTLDAVHMKARKINQKVLKKKFNLKEDEFYTLSENMVKESYYRYFASLYFNKVY